MTALSLLTLASAVLGVALWRGWWTRSIWPFYCPVALALVATPVLDLAQWVIGKLAIQGPTPYGWPQSAWFCLQAALFLAEPCAVLAAGLSVFLRWRTWPVAVLWLALSLASWAAYPALRQEPRLAAYAVVVGACCAGVFIAAAVNFARREVWIAHHIVALLLTIGQAVSLGAYALGNPERDWTAARITYGITFAIVTAYQGWEICRARPGS